MDNNKTSLGGMSLIFSAIFCLIGCYGTFAITNQQGAIFCLISMLVSIVFLLVYISERRTDNDEL